MPWAEIDQIELKDPAAVKLLNEIQDFSPNLDAQLIKELDNIAKEKSITFNNLTPAMVNPADFCSSKESPLQVKGEAVIKARSGLLIGLVSAWVKLSKIFGLSQKPNSVGNDLRQLKYMLPSSIATTMLDEVMNTLSPDYGQPSVAINRHKAMTFADSGQIDQEGKYTVYG